MTTSETNARVEASASDLSRVIEMMTTDKSNDWSEEIEVLVDIEQQLISPRMTVASLDGTIDEADWIKSGHVLDDHEVAYIRSLVVPASPTPTLEGSDG